MAEYKIQESSRQVRADFRFTSTLVLVNVTTEEDEDLWVCMASDQKSQDYQVYNKSCCLLYHITYISHYITSHIYRIILHYVTSLEPVIYYTISLNPTCFTGWCYMLTNLCYIQIYINKSVIFKYIWINHYQKTFTCILTLTLTFWLI